MIGFCHAIVLRSGLPFSLTINLGMDQSSIPRALNKLFWSVRSFELMDGIIMNWRSGKEDRSELNLKQRQEF